MPAPPIDLQLQPSRRYGYGLLALHAATYLLLWTMALPASVRVPLLVLAVLLSLRTWRHWRALARWRRLRIQDVEMRLLELTAQPDALVGAPTVLTSSLVILPLRTASRGALVPLFPDAMSVEDWRRLQVWLRCGSAQREKEH